MNTSDFSDLINRCLAVPDGEPLTPPDTDALRRLTVSMPWLSVPALLLLRHGGGHTSRQQPAAPVERENATVMQADTTAADTTRLATVPMQPGQAASAMQHDAADEPSSNTQQNVAKRHGTPEPGAGAPAAARHYTTEQER